MKIHPGFLFAAVLLWTVPLQAQTPPTRDLTGNFGVGLAMTSGNTDTTNFNLSFALVHDPRERNVVRFTGLYLRGDKDGLRTVDRTTVNLRDEFNLSSRVFLFAQNDYVRDKFKEIDYLLSPTAGLGYKLINTDRTMLALDSSLGGVWEKNTGRELRKNGAYNAGQRLAFRVSSMASLTQSLTGLWVLDDFSDALYNLGLGIAASITANSELKFEVIDSYKTRPPAAGLQKNDIAIVTAFVFKF
jgi:putative salt-induced outer membrane protein YdiY